MAFFYKRKNKTSETRSTNKYEILKKSHSNFVKFTSVKKKLFQIASYVFHTQNNYLDFLEYMISFQIINCLKYL